MLQVIDNSVMLEMKPVSVSEVCSVLCTFSEKTFAPISWACKKQTAVSHSSKEAKVISLDSGLRMEGYCE